MTWHNHVLGPVLKTGRSRPTPLAEKTKMEIETIDYINTEYEDDLTRRLKGSVFHLTSQSSFAGISAESEIRHNQYGRLPVHPGSENGFGRRRGWVSFFDFRNATDKIIEETRDRYFFINPTWFKRYHPDFTESKLAYLQLSEPGWRDLIPNHKGREIMENLGEHSQYIPGTECWYPGHVPIKLISKVILVRTLQDAPKENPFLYAHHLHLVDSQRNFIGHPLKGCPSRAKTFPMQENEVFQALSFSVIGIVTIAVISFMF